MYGDMTFKLAFTKVTISMGLMLAKTAEELCAFLATQIEDSLELHHPEHYTTIVRKRQTPNDPSIFEDKVFQLGFTFSFLVQQLQEIDKRVLLVRVAALVNDTVSRLMARSYTASGKTRKLLGVTFDTGTNGAHIEKLANIQKPIQGKSTSLQLEDVLDSHALSVDDTRTFKEIANSVVHRAARLSSISLAAIPIHRGALNHGTNDEPVDIGVDSSVIEHYPFYLDMVYEGLRAILGI
ncbi:hypothetical protein FOXG_04639 [Fusarium oxysporum f. sp. lycopersici 4287]|uniref:Phosphotransferase n=2 Tax=Fusarium oxysporum TaxID=5507 RepID=A0A0J9USX1_FUSO4|nr:hypothetical protein FOXG_04639 [Fusarium oxysporum f. sp. lycopersici 4287]KNB01376.1 hypothetical protein FOXG_04639 [Fusarium oxysporum f. sp. lycopersici 4287]